MNKVRQRTFATGSVVVQAHEEQTDGTPPAHWGLELVHHHHNTNKPTAPLRPIGGWSWCIIILIPTNRRHHSGPLRTGAGASLSLYKQTDGTPQAHQALEPVHHHLNSNKLKATLWLIGGWSWRIFILIPTNRRHPSDPLGAGAASSSS